MLAKVADLDLNWGRIFLTNFFLCLVVGVLYGAASSDMWASYRDLVYQNELQARSIIVSRAGTWLVRDSVVNSNTGSIRYVIEKGGRRLVVFVSGTLPGYSEWALIVKDDTITLEAALLPSLQFHYWAARYDPEFLLGASLRPVSYKGRDITRAQYLSRL